MPFSAEKRFIDPEIGEVTLRKSARSSRMSLRVHPVKGVSVVVPYLVPFAAARLVFEARRQWVLETMAKQRERCKNVHIPTEEEVKALRLRAKAELPRRLATLAETYGFEYKKVTIKHNSSNWGSCSSKGNINLNLSIMRLPSVLQDYVLLHELCHLRHHDHGHGFHLLLEHVLTDNLLKLMDAGDADAAALARKAAASKAKYPVDHVCSRAIRGYRLV